MANFAKVLKTQRRKEAARKGQITKLKNRIAKLERENWNFMDRCDKLEQICTDFNIDYELELADDFYNDDDDEEDDIQGGQQEFDRDIHSRRS